MADTKYMPNARLKTAVGLVNGNPFVRPDAPTVTEANALKNISAATRVNGYSFGLQASPDQDDRSWTDDASAQSAGFTQFGGDIPVFIPTNYADTADILQQVWTLIKTQGVPLWVLTRLGPIATTPFQAGDWVNTYKVLTDGMDTNTEGTGGGVKVVTFLPQGEVYPYVRLAPAAPVAVIVNQAPATATVGKPFWVSAFYQSLNMTKEVRYAVSDTSKLQHLGGGIFLPLAAGTAVTITGSYPGATDSTPVSINIS